MVKTTKATTSPRNPTRAETAIQEYANSTLTSEHSRQQAAILLSSKELLRNVQGLSQAVQTKFVDKVDKVRQNGPFFPPNVSLISAKAYPTINLQNAKFVISLGNVCSATARLPTSAVLSAGLEKRGAIAVASGGLTDVWRGEYNGEQVAIKAFRIYPAQNLKEAKEVRIQLVWVICSRAKFTDPVEPGADMEEVIP